MDKSNLKINLEILGIIGLVIAVFFILWNIIAPTAGYLNVKLPVVTAGYLGVMIAGFVIGYYKETSLWRSLLYGFSIGFASALIIILALLWTGYLATVILTPEFKAFTTGILWLTIKLCIIYGAFALFGSFIGYSIGKIKTNWLKTGESKIDESRRLEIIIAIIALLVSITAFSFNAWFYFDPGYVDAYPPTEYGIIRGMDSFPSDNLVIPMVWVNTGGQAVNIRYPYIVFYPTDEKMTYLGPKRVYELEGEFQDLSSSSFINRQTNKKSFILEPHSTTMKVLLFRIRDYWDRGEENNSDSNYNFRFSKSKSEFYAGYLGFQKNNVKVEENFIFKLQIYSSADKITDDRNKSWYDIWALN